MKIADATIILGSRLSRVAGANTLLGQKRVGSIFMLHSVLVDPDDAQMAPEHTSVFFLERVIRYYRSKGAVFISLSEAVSRIRNQQDTQNFITFTFDDGYRDNLTTVLPLFSRYNIPFTVYVTTDMVERDATYWWGGLQEILKRVDTIEYEPLGCRLWARTSIEKQTAYATISSHVRDGASSPVDVLALMSHHDISGKSLLERDALSRGDLRKLSEDPLVTIGGHTKTHCALSQVSLENANDEIQSNRHYLEELTQKPVDHFAYPFGDERSCGAREFNLVRDIGFSSAVTTRRGNLNGLDAESCFSLPRVLFSGLRESISYIEFQRCGTLNRFKK